MSLEESVTLKDFTESELKTILPRLMKRVKKSVDQGHSTTLHIEPPKEAVHVPVDLVVDHNGATKVATDEQGCVVVSGYSTTVSTFFVKK